MINIFCSLRDYMLLKLYYSNFSVNLIDYCERKKVIINKQTNEKRISG